MFRKSIRMKIIQFFFCLIFFLFFGYDCRIYSHENNLPEVLLDAIDSSKIITAADSALVHSKIQKLKGIEKYAVKDGFSLLASILKYKGDNAGYEKVIAILKKQYEYPQEFTILALDNVNGYIKFAPNGADVTYTMTYWNLSDGSVLIAAEDFGCGPVCSSSISFSSYKNGSYQNLENEKIIPGMKKLPVMLVPDYDESQEPLEFQYVLPKTGKNIEYCLNGKCIEMQFRDGVFDIIE